MNRHECEACQRNDRFISKGLCPRHKAQLEDYGYILDNNPRDEFDVNEIIEHKDCAEIILYDSFFNELDDRVVIDKEDIETVKGIIWKKSGKRIVGQTLQYTYELPNLLLDTTEKVNYLDGDFYNNRKSNLDIMKKKKFKHHFANHKKYKNKILVTSLGGSSDDVTGSCFAIEYPLDNGQRDLVLVECGSIQTNRVLEDYIANKKVVEGIPFNLASAIFVNHIHQDHIGLIPSGITRGFNGKIISSHENAELMNPMLLDASFIHNRNVMSLNNRGKKYEVLYDEGDVYSTLSKIEPYSVGEIHKLNSNLSFRFVKNNHCVGSLSLELFIKKPSGRMIKIVYTSDVGSKHNQKYRYYCDDRELIPKANCLIMESTYGESDRSFSKKDVDKEVEQLINKIKEVTSRGNRVLIPSFAFDRSQALMTLLYERFKDDKDFSKVKVVVDSRLLNNINNVFKTILTGDKLELWNEVLTWKNFMFVEEFKKTEILALDKDNPYVFISSSGMLSAGHSTTYAKSILPRKQDCICFIGYNSPNTTGGLIQRGNKSVTIDNVNVPVKCEICIYSTFSGHCQFDELIGYMKGMNCDNVYIHHGSKEAKANLKFKAEEEFLFSGITKKIHIIDKKNNQIIL